MISNKTKNIAQEIRNQFKKDGVSNRNISVVCKQYKDNGKVVEIINVFVLIPNTALDAYVEPIFNKFKKKYENQFLHFMLLLSIHCSH